MNTTVWSGSFGNSYDLSVERELWLTKEWDTPALLDIVHSAECTVVFGTNAYGKTYTVNLIVSDGIDSYTSTHNIKMNSSNYTWYSYTFSVPTTSLNLTGNLKISGICTGPSGNTARIFFKPGTFKIAVKSYSITQDTLSLTDNSLLVNETVTVNVSGDGISRQYKWYIGESSVLGTENTFTFLAEHYIHCTGQTTSGRVEVISSYSGGTTSTATANFDVVLDDTEKPSFSLTLLKMNPKLGEYVVGVSSIKADVTAITVSSGASIQNVKVECTGFNATNINAIGSIATYTTPSPVNTNGVNTVKVTVTDSRGMSTTATQSITAVTYYPPTITDYQLYRSAPDGAYNINGTALKASIDYMVGSTFGENKIVKAYLKYAKQSTGWDNWLDEPTVPEALIGNTEGTYQFPISNTWELNTEYKVRLYIIDTYGTEVYVEGTIYQSSQKVMDFSETHTAVGFGADVQGISNTLKVNYNWVLDCGQIHGKITGTTNTDRVPVIFSSTPPTGEFEGQLWLKPAE